MGSFYKKCKNLEKNAGVLGANETQIEQGRSMVEMLGVLAIIGVLSVGAISGYRYAMNKYRANQTVNELNLLSHQIAVAMMSKNGLSGTLKLGDPYDTNNKLMTAGYEFTYGCGDSGDDAECSGQNAFHFEVQKVSEGVCKELLTSGQHLQYIDSVTVNEGAGCQSGSENSVNFMFASSDFISEERVSPEDVGYCNSHGKYDANANSCECEDGYVGFSCQIDSNCSGNGRWITSTSYVEDGYCECNSGYVGKDCHIKACKGILVNASFLVDCDCPEGLDGPNCECQNGQKWDGTHCVNGNAQECDNDVPCPSGQYCFEEYGESCTDEFGSGERAQKGVCRSVEADSYKFGKYVASKVAMNWWSANRFCEAQGKSIITLNDLDCKHTFCHHGCDSNLGYCHNKNDKMAEAQDALGNNLEAWSPTLWEIRKNVYIAHASSYIRTGTEYDSIGSCQAYYVNLEEGAVNLYEKNHNFDHKAVCK